MSARAWRARKPGPHHLTGRQRAEHAARETFAQTMRRLYPPNGDPWDEHNVDRYPPPEPDAVGLKRLRRPHRG